MKFQCVFTDLRQAFLLVASRNQIVQDDITSQPNVVHSLVRDGRNIVALDFDSVTDRVYWSDTSQDRIWSASNNGSDRTVVSFPVFHVHFSWKYVVFSRSLIFIWKWLLSFSDFFAFEQIFDSGVTVTESLAVDWVGRNLYWTDYVLETVEVSKLDGTHRTVLVSENVTNPRGLVLDPRSRSAITSELTLWKEFCAVLCWWNEAFVLQRSPDVLDGLGEKSPYWEGQHGWEIKDCYRKQQAVLAEWSNHWLSKQSVVFCWCLLGFYWLLWL